MARRASGRSLPPGQEPWQTFTVRVQAVRGRREVRGEVALSHVTGIVGSTAPVPRPIWRGVVAQREAGTAFTAEDAARCAQYALGEAFPELF